MDVNCELADLQRIDYQLLANCVIQRFYFSDCTSPNDDGISFPVEDHIWRQMERDWILLKLPLSFGSSPSSGPRMV